MNQIIPWFIINGITKNIINPITKNNQRKINIIQSKSFIFRLFNLFRKGEKRMLKNKDISKMITTFIILYKNNAKIVNHRIINIFLMNFFSSELCEKTFSTFCIIFSFMIYD